MSAFTVLLFVVCFSLFCAVPSSSNIAEADVLTALENWGKGLVSISTAYDNGEDYVVVAIDAIKDAYNYDNSIVLFKPTVAAEIPFRTTFGGALSYFVGGNSAYPEDTGFALKHWRNATFEIVGIVYDTDRAICQTKTTFTNRDGATVLAYFSVGFTKISSGDLKIDLHHSSLPPTTKVAITEADVLTALENWGNGLVNISTTYDNGGDYVTVATNAIKDAYNYDNGLVLFKPTLSAAIPFRTTFDGALSYFVGGNTDFPEDTGFALKHWRSVAFDVIGIVYDTNRVTCQTKTSFTTSSGAVVVAYFSMAFTRSSSTGDLKIDLHHSSLPPSVAIKEADVLTALDNWGTGLVSISTAYDNSQDYVTLASDFIKKAYNYDNSIVLFKPTLAADAPFRTTFGGALSYFVGGNKAFSEDTGFALKHWTKVAFDVIGIVYGTDRAICQTKTTFTNKDGANVVAYFSMAFAKVAGELKLDLHHSSLPPASASKSSASVAYSGSESDSNGVEHRVMVSAIVLACISIVLALSVAVGFLMMNNRLKTHSAVEKADSMEQSKPTAGEQMVSQTGDNV
jgi:hypothetical protein